MPDEMPNPGRDRYFRQPRKRGKWRVVVPPCLNAPIADTHAHLQMMSDRPLAIARSAYYGVRFIATIVDVCEDGLETFENLSYWEQEAAGLLPLMDEVGPVWEDDPDCTGFTGANGENLTKEEAYPKLFGEGACPSKELPTIRIITGCHPHNSKKFDDDAESDLRRSLKDPRVCAVGEIGLDYYYDLSPRDVQRDVMVKQVLIAKENRLPVVLHLRDAHDDGFSIMSDIGFPKEGTLVHCFNLGPEEVKRWVDAGCYIAFGGQITHKNMEQIQKAALEVPLDRLLTETDAPFMSPEPLRGKACGPEHVVFNAAKLAEVYGFADDDEGRAEFLTRVYDNALRLLNRKRHTDANGL
ncbi:MAG: TatD family hydrolase [Eggerthellaceae bacterium]|nr:TatD family hydrolase [Eggerthellaceae bacterium]